MITAAALLALYMQAVNISIPNAALLHIQGTLSMTDDEVGWIFTSYLAAGAVVTPMARWLAGRYGRKTVLHYAISAFALGLVLATRADTPMQFVFARIVQGAAAGAIAPVCLGILLEVQPPARHPWAALASTVGLMAGLSSGPAIGGWLNEQNAWQAIFYLSLPAAAFIFLVMELWLPEEKAEKNPQFDFFGLAAFSFCMIGLQTLLDRGERMEWFNSAESWVEAAVSVLGFCLLVHHIRTAKAHFIDKALFKDRNFVLSSVMYFVFGFVLLPTLALTSPMLDELLGYPADTTGYMTLPRGGTLVAALILMSRVPARFDPRPFVASAMAIVVYANWLMLGYSPEMDWRLVATAGALQGTGLGILMPALTKTAFGTLDPKLRPDGTTLFNLARLYGSTIGVAVVQIFVFGNTQAMHTALAKDLTPYRAAAHAATGAVSLHDLAMLNEAITGQAAVVAVIGQFKILMLVMLAVSPLVLFLRKPAT
ncbi:MAG TPA: MFS transporter [Alphaproteobacteria bacterium]|nr:MFS transporter [Alphaproteobacteria bacterium]